MALVPFPSAQSQESEDLPTAEAEEEPGERMSFLEHLDEFRKRVVNICIGIAVGVLLGFGFIDRIFNFLLSPTRQVLPPGVKMIYTQPGEAFGMYITISLIAGAVIASPYIMFQVWRFIAPGLYTNEKRMAIPFVLLTTFGFIGGGAFNHFVAFPFMMAFFASFNTPDLAFMPKLQDVFGLYTKMLLGMGLIFQMPALVYFLAKMKLVTARFLWEHGKFAVLLAYVVAAIITPTADPVNQTIFAAPIIALYFASIGIAWAFGPKQPKKAAADTSEDAGA